MAAARRLPTRICWGSLENDRTFRTSNSYVGKYTIEGDITRYDIDVAQVPNMVGQGHSHGVRAQRAQ